MFNPISLGRWTLDHNLLRSVTDAKAPQRYQHLLHLSHHLDTAFVRVASPASDGASTHSSTVSIPRDQLESLYSLLCSKFQALWTPRATLQVSSGYAYDLGEFIIRLGELRQAGNPPQPRGVVVAITSKEAADDGAASSSLDEAVSMRKEALTQEDYETTQALIQDLWLKFGDTQAKQFTSSIPSADSLVHDFEEVKIWCDLLRLRG